MEQQRYDRTFYIRRLRMRTRIQQVYGDPWTYELTPFLHTQPEPTDTVVENQFEFDQVLAELQLIKLDAGRRIANLFARLTGLEAASARHQKWLSQHRLPANRPAYRMRRLDAPRPPAA